MKLSYVLFLFGNFAEKREARPRERPAQPAKRKRALAHDVKRRIARSSRAMRKTPITAAKDESAASVSCAVTSAGKVQKTLPLFFSRTGNFLNSSFFAMSLKHGPLYET